MEKADGLHSLKPVLHWNQAPGNAKAPPSGFGSSAQETLPQQTEGNRSKASLGHDPKTEKAVLLSSPMPPLWKPEPAVQGISLRPWQFLQKETTHKKMEKPTKRTAFPKPQRAQVAGDFPLTQAFQPLLKGFSAEKRRQHGKSPEKSEGPAGFFPPVSLFLPHVLPGFQRKPAGLCSHALA